MGIAAVIGVAVLMLIIVYVVLSTSLDIVLGLIVPIIIWGVIGYLAGRLVGRRSYGVVSDVLLGIGGGILLGLCSRITGIGADASTTGLIISIFIGAIFGAIVVAISHAIASRNDPSPLT